MPRQVQRRTLLALAGAGAATVGLASCTPLKPTAAPASGKASAAAPVGATAGASATGSASSGPVGGAAPVYGSASASGSGKVTASNPDGAAAAPGRPQGSSLPILKASVVAAPGETLPNLLGADPVWHLLRRATFGPTPDLVAEVRAKGIPS